MDVLVKFLIFCAGAWLGIGIMAILSASKKTGECDLYEQGRDNINNKEK